MIRYKDKYRLLCFSSNFILNWDTSKAINKDITTKYLPCTPKTIEFPTGVQIRYKTKKIKKILIMAIDNVSRFSFREKFSFSFSIVTKKGIPIKTSK